MLNRLFYLEEECGVCTSFFLKYKTCFILVDPQYTWLRTKCQRGTYGINCQKNCSTACRNSYCRNTDGICLDCPAGFRGPECSIGKY